MALDDQLAVFQFEPGVVEKGDQSRRRLRLKDPADTRLVGAFSDYVRGGTATHQQRQSAHDNRLAAAGLAREQVQTLVEPDLEPVDDGIAVDLEFVEHRVRAVRP